MIAPILLQVVANSNPLNWLQTASRNFDAQHAGMFIGIGSNLYTSFALILIVWTGIQIALSGNFQAYPVARLIMVLAFGKALIVYYAGGDYSICNFVIGQARYLADRIDTQAINTLGANAMQSFTALKQFKLSITNPGDVIWYLCAMGAYLMLQVVAVFVVCFGDVAVSVCVMLGPLFIPWFIVPKMDWLFWGWFRAFLQFGFYKVVASAVLTIIAAAANTVPRYLPKIGGAGPAPSPNGFEFLPTVIFALVAILVLFKVPMLTANIFSGSAGSDGGVIGTIQSAVSKATSVAGGGA